jgi:hypothetical protein
MDAPLLNPVLEKRQASRRVYPGGPDGGDEPRRSPSI